MAPGAIARVDGDLLAEGGTRLRFEAETLAEAPAPGPSHVAANSRANAWGERARGALLGAALATAAHAAYALADAEDTYGAHAALALLSRASRALASFVSVCANPLTSAITSDPVETFLRRADLLDSTSSGASAAAFRDAGYARAEDFWGITEHELEHVVKVALPAHRRRLVLLAERSRAAAALRADAARAVAASAALALALFVAAVCASAAFRKRVGVYAGIGGAIAWYHAKTYLDAVRKRRERRRAARYARRRAEGGRGSSTRAPRRRTQRSPKSALRRTLCGAKTLKTTSRTTTLRSRVPGAGPRPPARVPRRRRRRARSARAA